MVLAAVSPVCPMQSLTVTSGESVTSADDGVCGAPLNVGTVFGSLSSVNGAIVVNPQTGLGNQTVTYTHSGNAVTSNSFVREDENGEMLTFNIISPPSSPIIFSPRLISLRAE